MTMRLQQKHIVAIEMRADTATGGSQADHQVIQTRVRYKPKLMHQ